MPNHILFAILFLHGVVVQHWHQYKHCFDKVLITWVKFKDFFRKNLEYDWVFTNSIYSKLRRDFQYQVESALDWNTHLEYLQFILLEYDPVKAPTKSIILRYFQKGLKSSILAKLEHWDLKLESFNQMIMKAVNTKAKTAL